MERWNFKFIIVALLLFVVQSIFASRHVLVVVIKDGSTYRYAFSEHPVVIPNASYLSFYTNKNVLALPVSIIRKITIEEDDPTPVESVHAIKSEHDNLVRRGGDTGEFLIKPNSHVTVIDMNGKVVATYISDAEGKVSMSFVDFPKGVYIIKINNVAHKIVLK